MPGEDVIQFFCVSCGHKYRVPGKVAGKKSKCRECGTEMRVPDAAPAKPSPSVPPKAAAPKPTPPDPVDDDAPIGLLDDGEEKPGHGIARLPRSTGEKPKPTTGNGSGKPKQQDNAKPAKPGREASARGRASAKTEKKTGANMVGDRADASADAKWTAMLEEVSPAKPKPVEPIPAPADAGPGAGGVAGAGQAAAFSLGARPRTSGGGKEGFVAGLVSIQHTLTNAFSGSDSSKAPLSRRISYGGGFILVASLAALILSMTLDIEVSPASVLGERFSDGTLRQAVSLSPAAASGLVVGAVGLVVGLLLIGWRFMVPREDAESPLVLLSFAGFVLMTLVTGVAVLFAPGTVGLMLSMIFGIAIVVGAFVFGGWMLYRLNVEADGNGIMLLLVPALLFPTASVLGMLYRANERAQEFDVPMQWGEVNWGRLLLVWLITAVVMFVMGGVVGVWVLLAVPLLLFAASESSGGVSLGWGPMVALVCVLCYLWLFVTRWRVVLKPVGWQFAVLIFGLAVVGNYYAAADYKRPLDNPQVVVGGADRGRAGRTSTRDERLGHTSASVNNGEVILTTLEEVQTYGLANGIQINRLADGRFAQTTIPGHAASRTSQRYSYRGTDLLPPPAPAVPDFPRGDESPGTTPVASWPVFAVPEADQIEGGEWLNLGGYRILVPAGCSVRELQHSYFYIKAEIEVDGVEDALLTIDIGIRNDTPSNRGFEPFARMRRPVLENYDADQTEYGLISGQPFIRAERYPFPKGIVFFYFAHDDLSDSAFSASYHYDVRQPEVASRFEALVRSLAVPGEAEYLDTTDPAVVAAAPAESGLTDVGRDNLEASFHFFRGLSIPEHPALENPLHASNAFDECTAVFYKQAPGGSPENYDSVRLTIEPGHELDAGHNLFQVQGVSPLWGFNDSAIRVAGATYTLHRLWGDAVFLRINRGLVRADIDRNNRLHRQRMVTYAGYLHGLRIRIDLFDLEDAGLSMDELESYVHTIRLPTELEAREFLETRRVGPGIVRRWIENGQADVLTLEGTLMSSVYATDDAGGGGVPAIGTDPDPADPGTPTPAPIVLWPPLTDNQLAAFRTWSPDDDMLQHLDRESHALDGFSIRPLADLRKSEEARRGLQWTAVGGMSGVGMTMQIDTLDEDEQQILIPVLEDTPDRQSFQIGGRVIRSRGGAAVTYREQAGVRVWRILMPSQGDHTARTCYYVARAPGSAVVIRVRYNPNNPDQLDAFDAAVSTLRPLEPIRVEEDG